MSLFVLDTDTLSLYQRGHASIVRRIAGRRPEDLAITVLTVEEQLAGWFTLLRKQTERSRLVRIIIFPLQKIFRFMQYELLVKIWPKNITLSISMLRWKTL